MNEKQLERRQRRDALYLFASKQIDRREYDLFIRGFIELRHSSLYRFGTNFKRGWGWRFVRQAYLAADKKKLSAISRVV